MCHLLLDLYGCTEKLLKDEDVIVQAMDWAIDRANMSCIYRNVTRIQDDTNPELYGYTGLALLKESHLSVHTWPEENYVAVDMFSCRDFQIDPIVRLFEWAFLARWTRKHVIYRPVCMEKAGIHLYKSREDTDTYFEPD